MPLGEKGEICVKGPQVMKGYWKRPEETANQFVGDFLRTGDVGIMDEEGFIFIVDRIKDLIICSGYNVYPRRIEEAIYEHPAVEEVTVIGIKDQYRGEAPKAFIKLKAGAQVTEADIRKHLESKISQDRAAGRDRVPRRAAQDHDRQALQEGAEGRRGAARRRPMSADMQCNGAMADAHDAAGRTQPPLHHRRAGAGVRRHDPDHPLLRGKGLIAAAAPRRRALLFAARPGAAEADPARQEPRLHAGGDRGVPRSLRADPTQMAQLQHLLAKIDHRVELLRRKRADLDRTQSELKAIRGQVVAALKQRKDR